MKGTIFVQLLRMIEEEHGLDTLDTVIERVDEHLSTGGAYTSVGTYPHKELLDLIGSYASGLSAAQAEGLLDRFAGYIIREFSRLHPEFFAATETILDLMESVESHIHEAVLKLYLEANPPKISCHRLHDNAIKVSYESHRPLGEFALSLTREGAKLFPQQATIDLLQMSDDGCRAEYRLSIAA